MLVHIYHWWRLTWPSAWALPDRLLGDKAYDTDQLAEDLAEFGVELIAPHRRNRRPENNTQDGRPSRRYKRRRKAERTISQLQNYRRLCIP
jgi:transposase